MSADRESLLPPETIPDEEFFGPPCTGAADCPAIRHTHGCFADYGNCDDPGEHEPYAGGVWG